MINLEGQKSNKKKRSSSAGAKDNKDDEFYRRQSNNRLCMSFSEQLEEDLDDELERFNVGNLLRFDYDEETKR